MKEFAPRLPMAGERAYAGRQIGAVPGETGTMVRKAANSANVLLGQLPAESAARFDTPLHSSQARTSWAELAPVEKLKFSDTVHHSKRLCDRHSLSRHK